MPTIAANRSRTLLRELGSVIIGAAAGWLILDLWSRGHVDPYRVTRFTNHAIGAVFGGMAGATIRIFGNAPSEVRWDNEGLKYIHRGDVTHLPWSDLAGYRVTRSFVRSPAKAITLDRINGKPLRIDYRAFSEEGRAELFAELGRRSPQALLLR